MTYGGVSVRHDAIIGQLSSCRDRADVFWWEGASAATRDGDELIRLHFSSLQLARARAAFVNLTRTEIERKQKTRARGPVSKWLKILVAFSTRLSGVTESPMLSPFYNALLGSATGLVIFILIVFLVWIVRKRQIRAEIKKKQLELRKRYF